MRVNWIMVSIQNKSIPSSYNSIFTQADRFRIIEEVMNLDTKLIERRIVTTISTANLGRIPNNNKFKFLTSNIITRMDINECHFCPQNLNQGLFKK